MILLITFGSETWLTSSIPTAAISIESFSVIRQDRNSSIDKKGGGICIYVKNKYSYDSLEELCAIGPNYETLGIKVKIGHVKPSYILAVYRPPSGNLNKFMDCITAYLENLDLTRSEMFMLGDINIDYKSTSMIRKLKIRNFETKFNLKQLIEDDTRVTETTATTLDWIYTSTGYISDAGVLNYNISDHLPIFLTRKKPRNKIKKISILGRYYIRYDQNLFKQMLSDSDWTDFDTIVNPSIMWSLMEENIRKVLDQLCPIKQLTVPEHKPEWLNDEIIRLMRKRDKIYREARRKKDPTLWRKAIFLRNRVEMTIKTYKREKIYNELQQNQNNPKIFWESINSLIADNAQTNIQRLTDDEGLVHEGSNLPKYINHYFANIGKKLADNILQKNSFNIDSELCQGPLNLNNDNICNKVITELDIESILKDVNLNKSSAIHNIRTKVLVHAFQSQLTRVVKMYNGSLTLCAVPDEWKVATIVPLPKVNNPRTASDMRPISLLPFPGKILEILISKRLKNYLGINNILSSKQHGFREKKINSLCNSAFFT